MGKARNCQSMSNMTKMQTKSLSACLLLEAANNRHGLVLRPQSAHVSKSDVDSIFHVGVPSSLQEGWKSASGGVAFDSESAHLAAIGESVERYCAGIIDIEQQFKKDIPISERIDADQFSLYSEEQLQLSDFPFVNIYSDVCKYSQVFNLSTNDAAWVPHPLIVLRDDYATGIPTSSGLAAGSTATNALLRATEELIERDALMTTWMHSIPGRSIAMPSRFTEHVDKLLGEVLAFDLTPAYSPFPVIAVTGGIPQRGQWRYSLGVACRETLDDAISKAFLEWCQGVFFAGIYPRYVDTTQMKSSGDVKTFDDHAIFYTQNPDLWKSLPLFANKDDIATPHTFGRDMSPHDAMRELIQCLDTAGIDLYYRNLTTIDALQAGVHVVRVLSPQLVPIHSHHAWPFLGGSATNISMRYPEIDDETRFPNPYPHPLG